MIEQKGDAVGCSDPSTDLVRAARAGDEGAFARIVGKYERAVFAVAYRMTYDAAAAEDLTQEVFLRVWRKLDTFRLGEPLKPWLLRIATRVCINALKKRRPALMATVGDEESEPIELPSTQPDACETASQAEVAAHLERAIAELPDDYRLIVTLRHVEELSYEQIAAALELPLGTVKVRLFRARERLRRLLAPILGDQR
ncbi:MAG TPA: sigma-70 family RNA polymerase sigma factor [Planctomycetota bacterium]|nr:sigma-70 family RNA polymerase sigma factor [Planctomycetota bacterium]HRR80453.1 sigma-70 family RNA polymerase sigma factor [Planctomycetota bacterium]HRT96458.1 sigma-70 family RNA polymerase sigma factor [Planctomycetota bacterium]